MVRCATIKNRKRELIWLIKINRKHRKIKVKRKEDDGSEDLKGDFGIRNNDEAVLNYALENGMIDLQGIRQQIIMDRRQKILASHKYKISYNEKKGRWYTRFDDVNGLVQRNRKTREEIEDLVVEYYDGGGTFVQISDVYTFSQAHDRWLEMQREYGKTDNTIFKYEADWRRFFLGTEFSKMNIITMTPHDIEVFMISKIKDLGLKRQAGVTLWGYISGVFYNAVMDRKIDKNNNPCDLVDRKKFKRFYNKSKKPSAQRVFSPEELRMLILRLNHDIIERPTCLSPYGVRLALLTGMRSGEICGLRWSHITNDAITVCESEKFDQHTRKYFVSDTKTSKDRTIPLTDELISFLKDLKELQQQYGMEEDFVISTYSGKLHTRNLSDYMIKACKKLGFESIKNIHAIRRTFNSYLRQSGTSAMVAGSIIGNSAEVNNNHYTYDICDLDTKKQLVSTVENKLIADMKFTCLHTRHA